MEQGRAWAAHLTAGIGRRVAGLRAQQKISAQQLAERCAELGFPALSRIVITKLETGHREAVSIAELLVLAAALEVAPILLVLPLGQSGDMEILPGVGKGSWDAQGWWEGRAVFKNLPEFGLTLGPNLDEDILMLSRVHAEAIYRLQLFGTNIKAITAAVGELLSKDAEAAASLLTQMDQSMADQIRALAELRRGMRDMGFSPPPLPDAMANVDGLAAELPQNLAHLDSEGSDGAR